MGESLVSTIIRRQDNEVVVGTEFLKCIALDLGKQRGRSSPAYRVTKGHSNLRTGKVAVPTSQVSDLRFQHHRPGSRDNRTTPTREERRNGESLGHAQIIQLLKFCLKTYFTFDGTIYEQVKGTPMGSPISGLIAEAVLQRLESLVFRHHRPKFWARYVDDTFVVIERDQVLTFKEQLNAVFPDIQFTMEEEEENNQLAFLDVLVCRIDCGGL
nr:unnamed protein product [Spirometra erinaceieuropaei]